MLFVTSHKIKQDLVPIFRNVIKMNKITIVLYFHRIAGREAGRQAGSQTGRQAGRQTGSQADLRFGEKK